MKTLARVMLALIAALALLLMLSGCASSADNSPSPSYEAGSSSAKERIAADLAEHRLDLTVRKEIPEFTA